MQNGDLGQAIRNLQQELQKETQELHTKEADARKDVAENLALKNKLRTEEGLVPRLKADIAQLKGEIQKKEAELKEKENSIPKVKEEIRENESHQNKLKAEIATLKQEQLQKHNELTQIQKTSQDNLRKAGVKLR